MTRRCLKGMIAATVVAGLLAGCGGNGGGGNGGGGGGGGGGGQGGGGTADVSDVGFTFDYPAGLKLVTQDEGKVLLTAQIDGLNRIAVRKTSDQPQLARFLLESLRRQFKQQIRDVKPFKPERHSGKDMQVLEVNIPASAGSGGKPLHSVSYFFVASGRTWQLECLSQPDKRSPVTKACDVALGSIKDN
jgi:hypothetical protein